MRSGIMNVACCALTVIAPALLGLSAGPRAGTAALLGGDPCDNPGLRDSACESGGTGECKQSCKKCKTSSSGQNDALCSAASGDDVCKKSPCVKCTPDTESATKCEDN